MRAPLKEVSGQPKADDVFRRIPRKLCETQARASTRQSSTAP